MRMSLFPSPTTRLFMRKSCKVVFLKTFTSFRVKSHCLFGKHFVFYTNLGKVRREKNSKCTMTCYVGAAADLLQYIQTLPNIFKHNKWLFWIGLWGLLGWSRTCKDNPIVTLWSRALRSGKQSCVCDEMEEICRNEIRFLMAMKSRVHTNAWEP